MEFNQIQFMQVVEAARAKAAGSPRWVAAIDKAVVGLSGAWIVTELADGVMVTTESGNTYHANGKCQCKAFQLHQPCKHRAAARLLDLYNEAMAQRQPAPCRVAPWWRRWLQSAARLLGRVVRFSARSARA